MPSQPFVIFGNAHLITLFIIIAIAIVFPLIVKTRPMSQVILITKIMGVSLISLEFIKPLIWHYSMALTLQWQVLVCMLYL